LFLGVATQWLALCSPNSSLPSTFRRSHLHRRCLRVRVNLRSSISISISPVSAISLFIGLVKRRPALSSSPSCCMRAHLTGHEGKSRCSWPRLGSELRKVLTSLYFSLVLGSSFRFHVVCYIRTVRTHCQDRFAILGRLGCLSFKQRVYKGSPRGCQRLCNHCRICLRDWRPCSYPGLKERHRQQDACSTRRELADYGVCLRMSLEWPPRY
jgi:hypothetical protein